MFSVGDKVRCQSIGLIDDIICEPSLEDFFANLVLLSGKQPITVTRSQARVLINDSAQSECGKLTGTLNI